ncbi:uncharacterized protein LOC117105145 [Anneissia japonica]|uniref:uncharacterized protein LOC117105145 n=1 Tax=Anneissia japonica TaxID=1529436 RepID=UPI0014254CAC|nr:uncharacterized protein LOC117105145 [Anneissia japonica]XP_033102096.1 uncharacterized protein LOC117105145 [Anneissia japonica]XP_033102097.1 uncharacterized protein LOC117105145 [Anneissia japonica]XP_033102098.1 uncharacterized protein LOC117105145 [Anneissia japonica]
MFPLLSITPNAVDLTCFESLADEDDEHLERIFHQHHSTINQYYVEEYINDDSLVPDLLSQEHYHEMIPVLKSIYDGPLQDLFNDGSEEEVEEQKYKQSNIAIETQASGQLRHQLDAAVTLYNVDQQPMSKTDNSGDHSFWRANYNSDVLLLDLLEGNSGSIGGDDERMVPEVEVEHYNITRCTASSEEQLVPDWYFQSEE